MLESAFSSFWAQEYAGFELTLNREDMTWGRGGLISMKNIIY
jgi:hypothetical protein